MNDGGKQRDEIGRGCDAAVSDDVHSDSDDEAESSKCLIGFDNKRDTVLMPCMHFLYCGECVLEEHIGSECPSCRGEIEKRQRVFT